MIADTLARVTDIELFKSPIIVGSSAQQEIMEQVVADSLADLILEPASRNTAAAIALAALKAPPDAVLLILPSDHVIADSVAFLEAIAVAAHDAETGKLVTLGITPTGPETGYGYIELAPPSETPESISRNVTRFVEKPSRERAQLMLERGNFVWNSGIFLFTAAQYLNELGRFEPLILQAARSSVEQGKRQGRVLIPDLSAFATSPSISIDYAVMEKSDRVTCVPVDMGWSDVGSWDALYALAEKNGDGNALTGDAVTVDSHDCLIRGDGITVAAYGVDNLIIVATPEAVIVVPRGESQRVKDLLAAVQQKS